MKRLAWFAMLVLAWPAGAQTQQDTSGFERKYNSDNDESKQFEEQRDVSPPAFPDNATLAEIDVGAAATNRYYIDTATLTLGDDRVVRYVLVVKTSGGATNVSFEGMHCATLNWKHYATGRSDRTWTIARTARQDWRPIENKARNPHHAVLYRSFFCPQGIPITSAEDGRNALRLGKHPNSV